MPAVSISSGGYATRNRRLIRSFLLVAGACGVFQVASGFSSQAYAQPPLVIIVDGDPGDWGGVEPLLTDPGGDGPFNQAGDYFPGEDFLNISVANDDTNVYLLMEFVANHSGGFAFFLDTDQDSTTGCNGTEYVVFVTSSVNGGDPPALPGRHPEFDSSGSGWGTLRREPPSITQESPHDGRPQCRRCGMVMSASSSVRPGTGKPVLNPCLRQQH